MADSNGLYFFCIKVVFENGGVALTTVVVPIMAWSCCGILLVCSLHAPNFVSSTLYLVIVHSEHLKNEHKQKYGIKTNKIEIKLLRINDKTHVKKKSKQYWSEMHSVLTCDCHPSLVVVYVSYIKISLSYKLVELITQQCELFTFNQEW